MSSKTFLTIPKDQCLEVAKEILLNSKTKWNSGKKLAILNDYGGATSYLIISTEELIKSMILFFDGKGFDFRNVNGMDVFFRNHGIRHILSYIMFVISIFRDEMMRFGIKYKSDPDKVKELVRKISDNDAEMGRKMNYYLLRKAAQLKREFDWFSKVDIFRQNGFYCDYEDELKTPLTIDQKTYEEVYSRLKMVRNVGLEIINSFVSDEQGVEDTLENMRRSLAKNNHYDRISEVLSVVRGSKNNIFSLIKNKWAKSDI